MPLGVGCNISNWDALERVGTPIPPVRTNLAGAVIKLLNEQIGLGTMSLLPRSHFGDMKRSAGDDGLFTHNEAAPAPLGLPVA